MPSAAVVAAIGVAVLARLVYLDVWNREVSAVEDPGLLDSAVDSESRGTPLGSSLIDLDQQQFFLSDYLKRNGSTTDFWKALSDEARNGVGQVLAVALIALIAAVAVNKEHCDWGRRRAAR